MSARNEQCKKVCRILDDVLANRPSERDALIVAVQKAFKALEDDGWIPVEDRLPKIGNTVLATRFISKDHTYVDMSSYQGQDIGWKSNFDTYYGTNPYKVIAWRPLPKPYKPKEDTQ